MVINVYRSRGIKDVVVVLNELLSNAHEIHILVKANVEIVVDLE